MFNKSWFFLAVCLILSITVPSFTQEVVTKSSIEHFIPLPLTKQSNDYTCGAAIALSVLGYFGEETLEIDLVPQLGTNTDYGTDYRKMIQFFSTKGYQVTAHEGMTLTELKQFLDQRKPVICLIQAWEDNVKDYSNYWGIGHFVVAIGYDAERIYFMDPWVLGNYAYIPQREFVSRWHQLTFDKIHLKQWGMAISKDKTPIYNPEAVIYIP